MVVWGLQWAYDALRKFVQISIFRIAFLVKDKQKNFHSKVHLKYI